MTLQAVEPPLSPGNHQYDQHDVHHDQDDFHNYQDYDHDHDDDVDDVNESNHHDPDDVHHGQDYDHVDDDSDDDNDDGNNISFKEFSYQTRVHNDLGLVVKSQLKLFFIFLSQYFSFFLNFFESCKQPTIC